MIAPTEEMQELIDRALGHLRGIVAAAELDAEVTLLSGEVDDYILAITGPDSGLLVGQHGQTLEALQYLLLLMSNKSRDQRFRFTVDADGYRQRRTQTLIKFSRDLAAQVAQSGQEAITDPMNPSERRIVHSALVDHPDVETYSEGDEPNRYVVISPKAQTTPSA